MAQQKDQFVIANLADLDNTDAVLSYAIHLAKRLNKGLILLHIDDSRYDTPSDAEERLAKIKDSIGEEVHSSYAVLKGNSKEVIEALPKVLSGVVVITASDLNAKRKSPLNTKNILKDFSTCKTAYIVVRTTDTNPTLAHVGLTIDFHRESKEKLIWASYFARFGGGKLHILYHDYKDEGLRQKWYNNMLFLHKFFTNLGITFIPQIVPGKAASVDADALPFMEQNGIDLLVAVTTKEKDIFDSLLGCQEQKTIQNPQGFPVLFLNPRDDLYVLCD